MPFVLCFKGNSNVKQQPGSQVLNEGSLTIKKSKIYISFDIFCPKAFVSYEECLKLSFLKIINFMLICWNCLTFNFIFPRMSACLVDNLMDSNTIGIVIPFHE